MTLPASQPLPLDVRGFSIVTEARLVRADTFGGVFHVLSDTSRQTFESPVVVLIPGKWKEECDAHRAARDYAAIMAADGSLQAAVALRLSVGR